MNAMLEPMMVAARTQRSDCLPHGEMAGRAFISLQHLAGAQVKSWNTNYRQIAISRSIGFGNTFGATDDAGEDRGDYVSLHAGPPRRFRRHARPIRNKNGTTKDAPIQVPGSGTGATSAKADSSSESSDGRAVEVPEKFENGSGAGDGLLDPLA